MEHILSMGKTNDEISKGYTKQTSKDRDIIMVNKRFYSGKHIYTQQDIVAP